MGKPTIYLDTNIVSSYWYEGADLLALARKALTRDWWKKERHRFQLFISAVTDGELRQGVYRRQATCIKMIKGLRRVRNSKTVQQFASELVHAGVVPPTEINDSLQLAVATIHGLDYLPTWNYAHLANTTVQDRLNAVCANRGFRPTLLVSPETIPRVSLGHSLRRPK